MRFLKKKKKSNEAYFCDFQALNFVQFYQFYRMFLWKEVLKKLVFNTYMKNFNDGSYSLILFKKFVHGIRHFFIVFWNLFWSHFWKKSNIFDIKKKKFLFPLPTLSISIIILLYLAVCAKTWMEWKKWLRKRTKVLMICQNHDVPFNFWDPFDPRKWICNRKSWRTVVSKSPKISRYFLRENSNYFNLK